MYGDYECPYTRRAYRSIEQLERSVPELVHFVFRHFPLREIHPHAQECAEAAEAADAQGRSWELHDFLFHRQKALQHEHLLGYAGEVGLDVDRFAAELDSHAHALHRRAPPRRLVRARGPARRARSRRALTGPRSSL